MQHPGEYCKKCNKAIDGYRYKCIECDDFDLCESCESDYHSGHIIIRFSYQITKYDILFLKQIANRRPPHKSFLIQGRHDEEKCHSCGLQYFDGFVYKCCDCVYNACRRCEKIYHKCFTGNVHALFRFADPLSLNSFNRQFWLDIVQIRLTMRNQFDLHSILPRSATQEDFQPIITAPPVKHEGVRCNVCYNFVIGRRFKCIDCLEYDLCTTCEPKNDHLGHLLVRISSSLRTKVKRIFDDAVRLRLSTTNRIGRVVPRKSTVAWYMKVDCDICENSMHGYHYKCLECDFDLCSCCQMKEWHIQHLMVRFTRPLSQNPINQKFFEAVARLTKPTVYKSIIEQYKSSGSQMSARQTNYAAMSRNHSPFEAMTKPNMSTGFPASANQILYEAIMEFNRSTGSQTPTNHTLHEAITEPDVSAGSQMSTRQTLYEAMSRNQSLFEDITEPDTPTANQILYEEIKEFKLSTGFQMPANQILSKAITEPDMLISSSLFANQTLNKAMTDSDMPISLPLFEKRILSKAITETDMPISSPLFEDQIIYEGNIKPDVSTSSPLSANQTLHVETTEPETSSSSELSPNQSLYEAVTKSDMSDGSPTAPKQTHYEEITEPKMITSSSMQNLSRTTSRTNLTSKKGGNGKGKKRFISFVDTINRNDRIAQGQEKTIPNCSSCNEMPSEIMLLNCGHTCICSNCIDAYKKMSRQCPICKFPIRSTHRVHY